MEVSFVSFCVVLVLKPKSENMFRTMLVYCFSFIFVISLFEANCDAIVFPCKTPNNESAHCISLFSCPILMASLGSLEQRAVNFVKDSICLGCEAGDFMVCCGTVGNYLDTINPHISTDIPAEGMPIVQDEPSKKPLADSADSKVAHREHVKNKLLPSRRFCGFQHTDDRFYNSTETALDEFPWLVHVKFTEQEYEYEYGDRCHGAIISNRYILTDAYCGAEAVIIKIGQYKLGSNVSCVDNPDFEECTEQTRYIKVEEKIRSGKRENGPYDFTLLRLAEKITYSDYVRPICLPVDGSLRPKSDPTLIFSGWGANNTDLLAKKRLYYNITNEETCYDASIGLEGNVKFAQVSLACLIPKGTNTAFACNGEHGGPLMYKHRHQWFAEGVIIEALNTETQTTNFDNCSKKDPVSGIFITPAYMEWILDSIKD